MLLVIDSGNTNIAFAVYDGERQRGHWRAATDPRRTADEYAVWLTQLMALEDIAPRDIEGVVMANVVPAAEYALRRLGSRYFGGEPLAVGDRGVKLGVAVHMERPEEVGADRLVNALAGYERYGGPLVVIDFGTATTFDVVGVNGAYEGGCISPGIDASMQALHAGTAKLPGVAISRPPHVIGKTTVQAIQSGVFWGYVGLIEGILTRIERDLGAAVTVVATGGLATLFSKETSAIHSVDPDLTLRGLLRVYELNRPTPAS